MNQIGLSVIISVFTGILTSAIIAVAVHYFRVGFLPWYEDRIYSGVRIEGQWKREFTLPGYGDINAIFTISQNGSRLTGDELTTFNKLGNTTHQKFKLNGFIFDRFVTLNSRNNDRSKMGYMTMLMEVGSHGDQLKGMATWYDQNAGHIISELVILTKIH